MIRGYQRLDEDETYEISRMTDRELKSAIKDYRRYANNRLSALERSEDNVSSEAYNYIARVADDVESIEGTVGHLRFASTRNLTHNQMVQELTLLTGFLNAKTSTVTGVNAHYERIRQSLVDKGLSDSISLDEIKDVLQTDVWQSLRDAGIGSNVLFSEISKARDRGLTFDRIVDFLEKYERDKSSVSEYSLQNFLNEKLHEEL